jgi:hypothetical protein
MPPDPPDIIGQLIMPPPGPPIMPRIGICPVSAANDAVATANASVVTIIRARLVDIVPSMSVDPATSMLLVR